jgi:hypothetical protein
VDKSYDYLPFGEELMGGTVQAGDASIRGRQRLEFTSKERDAKPGWTSSKLVTAH